VHTLSDICGDYIGVHVIAQLLIRVRIVFMFTGVT